MNPINPNPSGNLKISNDGYETILVLPRRFNWQLILSITVVLIVIVGLNVLLYYAGQSKNADGSNTFMIFQIIFRGIGGIMLIGLVIELLRKQYISLERSHLTLGYVFPGFRTSGNKYEWQEVTGLKITPPHQNGFHKVEEYSVPGHKHKTYAYDNPVTHPMLMFFFGEQEVHFAKGLDEAETTFLFQMIRRSGFYKHTV